MLKKAQLFCIVAIIIPGLLSLSACGGGSGVAIIKSVTITPTTATVPVNTTTQFSATVNLSDSTTTTKYNRNLGSEWCRRRQCDDRNHRAICHGRAGGNFTAPAVAPGGTDNGQVDVTAVATQTATGTSTTPTTVTSNTAVVTIGAGSGLAVTPTTTTVPAGGSHLFTATLNSVADPTLRGRSALRTVAISGRSIRLPDSTQRLSSHRRAV